MKIRNIIIAVLLFVSIALFASNIYFYYRATRLYENDFLSLNNFDKEHLKKNHNNNTMKQPTAVLIGNSITEQWSYYHPNFINDNNFINAGIGGQSSMHILLRFRNDVVDLKPKVVVISAGINDIGENAYQYNQKFTSDNIKSMADIAHANGIKVIIASLLPAENIPWNVLITNTPKKIKELNAELKEFCEERGYNFLNYYPALLNDKEGLKAEYTVDNIHLNAGGYSILEPILKDEINKVLAQ